MEIKAIKTPLPSSDGENAGGIEGLIRALVEVRPPEEIPVVNESVDKEVLSAVLAKLMNGSGGSL